MSAPLRNLGFCSLLKFPTTTGSQGLLKSFKDVTLNLPTARTAQGTSHNDLSFSLDVSEQRPLIPTYGSVGRATVVIPVKTSGVSSTLLGNRKLMVKISWQLQWRIGEDGTVRAIREGLASHEVKKKFLGNIVDMKCSSVLTMAEMDLPRARMFGLAQDYERVCRVLVLAEYLPLKMIKNANDFGRVFLDVVRGEPTSSICSRK